MAVPANFFCPEKEKFQHCYQRLTSASFREEVSFKTDLNLLIDELNALEYTLTIVRQEEGNQLLLRLCSIVPLHEERLVVKLCQVLVKWRRKQMLPLQERCLVTVTDYLIKAIERCPVWTRPDIVRALAAVVYENCDRITQFHEGLVGAQGVLLQLLQGTNSDSEALVEAVQCLECLTAKPPGSTVYLSQQQIQASFDAFTALLHTVPTTKLDQLAQSKILISSLRGLQNILQVTKTMPVQQLGHLLAAVRAYMFFGLYSQPIIIPESLHPTPFSQYKIPSLGRLAVPFSEASGKPEAGDGTGKTATSAQKKSKRKKLKKPANKTDQDTSEDGDAVKVTDSAAQSDGASGLTKSPGFEELMVLPAWNKISSSESDWSDTEGGQRSRLQSYCIKVRQCALGCFYWIVKNTDKKYMFGYWSSFIPEAQTTGTNRQSQTLFTLFLKDPAPKCRMGALAALSVLVDGTKPLLTAAEDSDDTKTTTFTPFSVVLGTTIRELHRCLLLAMVSENYPITLTQLIKCMGTVIANIPYHRMRPGLLSRIVKQIRHFIHHRDPNIRVACLTCLGAMAGIQPPLMEVCHIIQPPKPPVTSRFPVPMETDIEENRALESSAGLSLSSAKEPDSGFSSSPSCASPGRTLQQGGEKASNEYSGGTTPRASGSFSGTQTPVFSDQLLQAHAKDISWVVKLCVKNILPQPGSQPDDLHTEPLPVRLESLQLLAYLTKGYFPIIRNCVPLIRELIHNCYHDSDAVVRLHTAKLLDEFTQVLLQDLQSSASSEVASPEKMDKQQVLDFWLSLLMGPVPQVLQERTNSAVRATTCDCVANIGDSIFSILPMDKRILCITLVLGLTSDEDRLVRASAIRTLGVYVMYGTLREDVSFIADAASAILYEMEDKSVAVRVKAAWSLANLCDTLAVNREEGDQEFVEEFSEAMLLNIVTMATKCCQDSDKVKANGVRALGNILRYIPAKSIDKTSFTAAVDAGIKALVKNIGTGAMKVRWNACYAISNMYKNTDLPHGKAAWTADVISALCAAVKDCKNFKVRINAAVALTSPKERFQFGDSTLLAGAADGLIESLSTAEDIADFIDFRYRDSLTDQISGAILHLVSMVTAEDMEHLLPTLQTRGEFLMTCLNKYYANRPDKSQIDIYLPLAMEHLDSLVNSCGGAKQSDGVEILRHMCQQLVTGSPEGDLKPPEKTAFVETYD